MCPIMPVSGLKILLSGDEGERKRALDAIRRHPSIEMGVRADRHLAAVVDARDDNANRAIWGWLNELPGVEHVDVVFVSIDHGLGPRGDTIASRVRARPSKIPQPTRPSKTLQR